MKNLFLTITLFFACLAVGAQTVAVIDYMKVPEDGGSAYVAIEQQWKLLHQSRVESGSIIAWELYYVRNSGTTSPYNFVTATIYENFAKTENWATEAEMKKVFGEKMDDFLEKTSLSRDLIYTESYTLQTGISADVPDKYIVVNSIKTDNTDAYINMENVGYKPLHEEAKKMGQRNSWGIWTRWPNNDNAVQAVAVDGFTKFENINSADYGAIFDKIKGGMNAGQIWDMMYQSQQTDKMRTIVKSEIWELIDVTTPRKL